MSASLSASTLDAWDWPLIEAVAERVRNDPDTTDLRATTRRHLHDIAPLTDRDATNRLLARLAAHLTGLGPLDELLVDPEVSEVIVNGGGAVWIERRGRLEHIGGLPASHVETLIERVVAPLGLRFDRTSPIVDARLADGSRLCAVLPPVSVDGALLSIRRFALAEVDIAAFADAPVADVLRELVARRCNVVVSGATSAGKTTLLAAMCALVPAGERIITIEDTAELRIDTPHLVRLEARPATPDGVDAIDVGRLVRAALRLRPDRLVIGEVRGHEAWDMVQALNTGHDGCLTTVHANGPIDAIRRITALASDAVPRSSYRLVAEQVRASLDAVVHLSRGTDGIRSVTDIAEVAAPDETGALVRPIVSDGRVVSHPARARVALTRTVDRGGTT